MQIFGTMLYDNDLYVLVQALKHSRHYLLGKEFALHIDHHPLIFPNPKIKLQEQWYIKWTSYIEQFNLVIKYNKGNTNKIADMLNCPPLCVLTILNIKVLFYEQWKQ